MIKRTLVPGGTLDHKTKVALTHMAGREQWQGLEVRAKQKQNLAIKPAFYNDLVPVGQINV